ncbi:MAG: type III-B CRISPR module RAMP protein Cmr1 [Capsulimonadaceae bacterium]
MPKPMKHPAPPWSEDEPSRSETWTLSLTTITPMFGGSAVAREVGDPPIRAASIRGHLRFWWRATAGAGYTDPQELYKAESRLWGDTEKPGEVVVRVAVTSAGRPALLRDYLPSRPSPKFGPEAGYFVFPFNEDNDNSIADGRKDVKFTLLISTSAGPMQDEVRRAVHAWLTFGGVGARTRRGCGSLMCEDKAWLPKSKSDAEYFRRLIVGKLHSTDIPTLAGSWIMFGNEGQPDRCWRGLGRFWAHFHKGHYTTKRPEYQPMSGGEWLDHASLKSVHGPSIGLAKPYLGLPIIYQDFSRSDPKFRGKFHGTLEPETSGRMASPVILKPVAFSDGVRPMVACLSAPPPMAIKIGTQTLRLHPPSDDPVLRALRASAPLEAVRAAARRYDFQEVPL